MGARSFNKGGNSNNTIRYNTNAATIIFASLYPPQTIITPPPPPLFFLRTLFGDPPPPKFLPHYTPLPTFSPNKPSGFFVFVPFLVTPNYIDASLPRPPPRFFLSSYPFRWPPYIFVTLLPLPYIFASLPPPPWFFVFVRFSVTPLYIFASLPP